jgi:hypothetical protein
MTGAIVVGEPDMSDVAAADVTFPSGTFEAS